MRKLFLFIGIMLTAALISTAGCTANNPESTVPGSITGTETYTFSTMGSTTEYKITFLNGINTGNQKIDYDPNFFGYTDEFVNKVVPEIIIDYQNNPMSITQNGNEIVFTLENTEVTETIGGEKHIITATSATEVYLDGQQIDTLYFTK